MTSTSRVSWLLGGIVAFAFCFSLEAAMVEIEGKIAAPGHDRSIVLEPVESICSDALPFGEPLIAKLDREGRFVATLPAISGWRIHSTAGETLVYVPPLAYSERLGPIGAPVEPSIPMSGSWTVRARVVDEVGEPISSAFLRHAGDPRCFATTSGEGWLSITIDDSHAAGHWHLGAPEARILSLDTPMLRASTKLVLPREPRSRIEGRVVDRDDSPIEGARIHWSDAARTAFSGQDGRFVFEGVSPEDRAKLEIRHDNFFPAKSSLSTPELQRKRFPGDFPRQPPEVKITLDRPSEVVGRLLDSEDSISVTELEVTLSGENLQGTVSLQGTVFADGRFAIERVPAGPHWLRVDREGETVARVELETEGRGGVVDLGSISLGGRGRIEGRVVDSSGAPIPDVSIELTESGNCRLPRRIDGVARRPIVAETSAGGFFSIEGLSPSSTLSLGFSKPGYTERSVVSEVPTFEPLEIEMIRLQNLEVEIVSALDGEPVSWPILTLSHGERFFAPGSPEARCWGEGTNMIELNEEGRATIWLRAGGEPKIGIDHPDFVVHSTMPTKEDLRRGSMRIELTPAATISGRVFTHEGEPSVETRISAALGPESVAALVYLPSARTDAEGRFEIRGVRPGSVNITLQPKNGRRAERRTIEVLPGGTAVDLYLDPPPSSHRLSGEVRFADGEPAHGLRGVPLGAVRRGDGAEWFTVVDPSGGFVFEELPEDEYDLFLQGRRTGRYFRELEGKTIDLREDVDRWVLVVEEVPPPEERGE